MSSPTNEFQFKVKTVKWFGILCGIVIILMIALGFFYLHRIVELSKAYESKLDFAQVLDKEVLDPAIVTLGLEHDGLSMRNKRGVSALYMRAYAQFLAIITGMVLALLGAVFVLARVDSIDVKNELGWGNVKWLLTSSSPGLVTSIIGTLLIGTVVYFSSSNISVMDGPIYTGNPANPTGTAMERARRDNMASPDFVNTMRSTLEKINSGASPTED